MGADVGRTLIVVGAVMLVLGLLIRVGALSWFGNLPGDIRITSGRTRVFVPLTSMLLVSVVLSVVLAILRR
jgi:membrane protein implicated in regulation of membrane protease activity